MAGQGGNAYIRPGQVADATNAAAIYRTGLPGRPTSWQLIERECRRRYVSGERHPSKVGESATEWARVLIAWLNETHEDAPVPKEKTLTNKLAPFLRDLATDTRTKS